MVVHTNTRPSSPNLLSASAELMKATRAMRMNTDVKKRIFIAIVTAEVRYFALRYVISSFDEDMRIGLLTQHFHVSPKTGLS